jgi:uncharacterized damage-inducible protein DinB
MTGADLCQLFRPLLDSLDKYFALVPDDLAGLDQPCWQGEFQTPDGAKAEAALTLRQLMVHLLVASYEVPRVMAGASTFDEVRAVAGQLAGQAPSALRAGLAERRDKTLALLADLDESALAATRQLPFGQLTGTEALLRAALHIAHHKGQMSVVLRHCGIRPGAFL